MRRSRRSSPRAPRRKTQWEWSSGSDITDLIIGFDGSNDGGNSALWLRPPAGTVDTLYDPNTFRWPNDVTLMFMRFLFNARAGPIPALNNSAFPYQMNVGVIKWPGIDDVVPSPDDTPDPSDGGLDWIFNHHVESTFFTWAGLAGSFGGQFDGTSKARRKIDMGEGLLMVVNLTTAQDAVHGEDVDPITYQFYARWLVKLP